MLTRSLLAFFALTLHAQSPPAGNARRVALVIGNNDYPEARLVNSVRDAETMRTTLTQLGFTTQFAVNTTLRDLDEAISRFFSNVQPGDVVLFYYSGHGIQLLDQNYLLPVDFKANSATDAAYAAYPVARVLGNLEEKGVSLQIIVLDACRNNPFSRGWRGDGNRGLLPMNAGRGTYIAFATAPGSLASDNPTGRNGLFTEELASTLNTPGLTLDQIFNQVRARVSQRSTNKQIPWSTSSVIGDFYFRQPVVDVEVELWRAVERLNTDAAYAEYLRQFPNGRYSTSAKLRTAPKRSLTPQFSQRKLALVIGNSDYPNSPLPHSVTNARIVGEAFRKAGYSVTTIANAKGLDLKKSINDFTAGIHPRDVAFFYYSGHGIEKDGANFLLPVDFSQIEPFKGAESIGNIMSKLDSSGSSTNLLTFEIPGVGPNWNVFTMGSSSAFGSGGTFLLLARTPDPHTKERVDERLSFLARELAAAISEPALDPGKLLDHVRIRIHSPSDQK